MNNYTDNEAYTRYTKLLDGVAIDFEPGNGSKDTILTVLHFIEDSYFYSAIKLLDILEEKLSNDRLAAIVIARYFAPALFLSRHYIELRMKFLIARYGVEPDILHDLDKLNKQYKRAIEDYAIKTNTVIQPFNFEPIIEKIEQIEVIDNKNAVECYRYLYDQNYKIKTHLEIHLKDIREIRNILMEVMHSTAQISQQDAIHEILNKPKKNS